MHRTVTRDDWLVERRALLAEEKELTRRRDALAEKRRALPWVPVDNRYEFDGADGGAHRSIRRSVRTSAYCNYCECDPA